MSCTSRTRRSTPLLLLAAFTLCACDKKDSASELDAAAASSSAPSATPAASSAAPADSANDEPPTEPLQLQGMTFTSNVEGKEPVDVLVAAEPGQRVWAHLRLRNRSGQARKIHLEFRVNDQKRTTLDLDVAESWSYRTWAFNTLQAGDKTGTVSLKVTDDSGAVLADSSVPIAAKKRTKAFSK